MSRTPDPIDRRLLDEWQRDLPLVPQPYAAMGAALGLAEEAVIARLARFREEGAVARVGATIRPNAAGASTLGAIAAPEWRVDEVAAVIGAEPGVNHSYLRENRVNLWFVATGPDAGHVAATLGRIRAGTGLDVLDLRLERAFNVDLGFPLGAPAAPPAARPCTPGPLEAGDRAILQALSEGLALCPRPFADLARRLSRTEADVLDRVRALAASGILARVGVILRHRALGYTANAMVVWDIAAERAEAAGRALVTVPGVTLCYRRRAGGPAWPYTLYNMIHARTRPEALAVLDRARACAGLDGVAHEVLFSLRCFKQQGALIAPPGLAA